MPKVAISDITFDRIRAFVNGDTDKISEVDQRILTRFDYAYDQLKVESRPNTVKRLVRRFNISAQQARADVRDCLRLFNPINRTDVEWIENFIVEDAKLQLIQARKEGNMRAWGDARSQLIKMYALLAAKQTGIDPDQLGNNNYFAVIANGDKVIKFNMDALFQLPEAEKQEIVEDILFEEIDEEQAKILMNE